MIRAVAIAALAALLACDASAEPFRDAQLRFPRVRAAHAKKGAELRALFEAKGLPFPPAAIYLRALKADAVLELWAKARGRPYELVKEYRVCARSGALGPKRRMGDGQVPEGFYSIDRFNPQSAFHLSLGLDYPNASDRALGEKGRLGGDIFIHGSCVTIGCLPIEDEFIEELYLAAVEARGAGQKKIPVHVFPTRLDAAGLARLEREARGDEALVRFWRELQPAWEAFERTRELPRIRVARDGRYVVDAR